MQILRITLMNIPAIIAAFSGVISLSIAVYYGNRLEIRILRYLSAAFGLVISIVVMSYTPTLLGDSSTITASTAGTYFAYMIVTFAIIKGVFFRKKKESAE